MVGRDRVVNSDVKEAMDELVEMWNRKLEAFLFKRMMQQRVTMRLQPMFQNVQYDGVDDLVSGM